MRCAHGAGPLSGWSATPCGPTCARATSRRSRARTRRSCSGTRSSTCARPGEALRRAADLLMPGGVLVVSLPNVESWQARAFGDRWFALDLPRHLVHVPAPALIARIESLGLRVQRTSHLRGGQVVFGWLHGLTGALPGHPDLYAAIRRPEARDRPLSRGAPHDDAGRGGGAVPGRCRGGRSGGRGRARRHDLRGGPEVRAVQTGPPTPHDHRHQQPTPRGRPPAGQDRRRHAGVQRGQDARADLRRHPRRLGRRRHPGRRQVARRHHRGRPHAAAAGHLAPAQRGLRRQPEDVLPVGAAARRRRRGDAPPRRPVRAHPDPQARRPHPARRGRPRPRLAPRRRPPRRAEGQDAALEADRQPVPDRRREPDPRHRT